jgi:hypothetical protein
MTRFAVLAAALALLLAACSGFASPSPARSPGGTGRPEPTAVPGTSPSPGAGVGLLLEIVEGGGLVPEHVPLVQLPMVAVYADGRMITPGPMIEIYPGPALPNLQVSRLSADGLARIVALARQAGLVGPDRTLNVRGIADAGSTIFTTDLDGARHRTVAVALGYEVGVDISAEDRAVRAALLELQRVVVDLRSVPGVVVGEDRPYGWTALRIVVLAGPPAIDPAVRPVVIGWPVEPGLAEFGEAIGAGVRCGVLSGEELARMRALFEQSNQLTRWLSEGVEYGLYLRPLLPHESGCEPPF